MSYLAGSPVEQPECPGNSHPGGQGQGQHCCPPYNKGQGWPPPLSQLHMVARVLWQSLMRVFLWKGSAPLWGESGRVALNQWSAESKPGGAERASAPAPALRPSGSEWCSWCCAHTCQLPSSPGGSGEIGNTPILSSPMSQPGRSHNFAV